MLRKTAKKFGPEFLNSDYMDSLRILLQKADLSILYK